MWMTGWVSSGVLDTTPWFRPKGLNPPPFDSRGREVDSASSRRDIGVSLALVRRRRSNPVASRFRLRFELNDTVNVAGMRLVTIQVQRVWLPRPTQ